MTPPDVQATAAASGWPVAIWADAWSLLKDEVSEHRQQPLWDAVVALSPIARPDDAMAALVELTR